MSVTRGDLGMLFGLAGLLLAGAACYLSFRADRDLNGQNGIRDVMKSDGEMIETMASRTTEAVESAQKLREDLAASNVRISALQKELDATTQRLNGIETRLGLLEAK